MNLLLFSFVANAFGQASIDQIQNLVNQVAMDIHPIGMLCQSQSDPAALFSATEIVVRKFDSLAVLNFTGFSDYDCTYNADNVTNAAVAISDLIAITSTCIASTITNTIQLTNVTWFLNTFSGYDRYDHVLQTIGNIASILPNIPDSSNQINVNTLVVASNLALVGYITGPSINLQYYTGYSHDQLGALYTAVVPMILELQQLNFTSALISISQDLKNLNHFKYFTLAFQTLLVQVRTDLGAFNNLPGANNTVINAVGALVQAYYNEFYALSATTSFFQTAAIVGYNSTLCQNNAIKATLYKYVNHQVNTTVIASSLSGVAATLGCFGWYNSVNQTAPVFTDITVTIDAVQGIAQPVIANLGSLCPSSGYTSPAAPPVCPGPVVQPPGCYCAPVNPFTNPYFPPRTSALPLTSAAPYGGPQTSAAPITTPSYGGNITSAVLTSARVSTTQAYGGVASSAGPSSVVVSTTGYVAPSSAAAVSSVNVTTAARTSAVATSAALTSGVATSGVQTSAVGTSAVATSARASSVVSTTGAAATSAAATSTRASSVVSTTGVASSGAPTSAATSARTSAVVSTTGGAASSAAVTSVVSAVTSGYASSSRSSAVTSAAAVTSAVASAVSSASSALQSAVSATSAAASAVSSASAAVSSAAPTAVSSASSALSSAISASSAAASAVSSASSALSSAISASSAAVTSALTSAVVTSGVATSAAATSALTSAAATSAAATSALTSAAATSAA
ncbi:hypothetical protein HDV06_001274, partial [Boothiomyces sp. JEL0866]